MTIKLASCSGVQPRRDGIQPSAYCVYKFFDFADHVTSTVSGSNNPQFNDSQTYNIPMTADVDKYLKTKVKATILCSSAPYIYYCTCKY